MALDTTKNTPLKNTLKNTCDATYLSDPFPGTFKTFLQKFPL